MKNLKIFSIVALTTLVLFACKKEDKPSASQLLSRNWKQTDLILTVNGASQSVFSQLDACSTDDIYQFKSDGTLTISEGATKCNPTDPDVYASGTWQFQSNNTKLALNDNANGQQVFNVESLSATDLVLSDTTTISNVLTKGTFYFKAQ